MAEISRASASRARLLAVIALLVGVLGSLVLWFLAGQRYDDAVADLAPAPIGCDTTLVFDRTGTYTIFVETEGSVGTLDGDCGADDREYHVDTDSVPPVSLSLVDEDGVEVDLDRASGPSYDRSGSRGTGVRTVDIERAGDFVLTASSEQSDVMIRVGRDPSSGVAALRIGAVLVLLGGFILFALGWWRGRPRPVAPEQRAVTPWPTLGQRPPPVAPPYANPPVPPPYSVPARPPLDGPTASAPWASGGGQLPPPRAPG